MTNVDSKALLLAAAFLLASILPGSAPAQTLSVEGFAWAENLTFDGRGHLFVSENLRGEVWRIEADGEGGYTSALHLSGFEAVLGLAASEDGHIIYAVGRLLDDSPLVFGFSADVPETWWVIAPVPQSPNGLERNNDGHLFVTTEGSFIPGRGEVYEIEPETGSVWTVMTGLWAPDGAAIDLDGQLLYVGEVVSGKIWTYDLATQETQGYFQGVIGKRGQWLDDFCISDDGSALYGADFARRTAIRVPIGEEASGRPDVLGRLDYPTTSAAFGSGPGFRSTSLYVTEGGGIAESTTDRRVVEIPNVR